MRGIFKDSSVALQILQFCLLFLFFLLLCGLCTSILEQSSVSSLVLMRILICLQFFFLLFLFPLTLAFLWGDSPIDELFLRRRPKGNIFLQLFFLMLLFIPFFNLLGDLNGRVVLPEALGGLEALMREWEERADRQLELLFSAHSLCDSLLNLLLIALLPAIGEELFFRATLQRVFTKMAGSVFAVWVTAFLFSAVHFQFFGFLPRFLFGAFFAYLLLWSKSLWLPIFAHFVNNALIVVFYSLSKNGYDFFDIDEIGVGSTLWLGILCGGLSLLALFYFKREIEQQQ